MRIDRRYVALAPYKITPLTSTTTTAELDFGQLPEGANRAAAKPRDRLFGEFGG
jgi:hypothetical protein